MEQQEDLKLRNKLSFKIRQEARTQLKVQDLNRCRRHHLTKNSNNNEVINQQAQVQAHSFQLPQQQQQMYQQQHQQSNLQQQQQLLNSLNSFQSPLQKQGTFNLQKDGNLAHIGLMNPPCYQGDNGVYCKQQQQIQQQQISQQQNFFQNNNLNNINTNNIMQQYYLDFLARNQIQNNLSQNNLSTDVNQPQLQNLQHQQDFQNFSPLPNTVNNNNQFGQYYNNTDNNRAYLKSDNSNNYNDYSPQIKHRDYNYQNFYKEKIQDISNNWPGQNSNNKLLNNNQNLLNFNNDDEYNNEEENYLPPPHIYGSALDRVERRKKEQFYNLDGDIISKNEGKYGEEDQDDNLGQPLEFHRQLSDNRYQRQNNNNVNRLAEYARFQFQNKQQFRVPPEQELEVIDENSIFSKQKIQSSEKRKYEYLQKSHFNLGDFSPVQKNLNSKFQQVHNQTKNITTNNNNNVKRNLNFKNTTNNNNIQENNRNFQTFLLNNKQQTIKQPHINSNFFPLPKDKINFIHRNNTNNIKLKPTERLVENYIYDKANILGTGAFAKVYLGHHKDDAKNLVAVKEIDLNKTDKKKFMDEINIMKNLKSQYIVAIYDAIVQMENKRCYLILEYCQQGTLQEKYKSLSREESLNYFCQIVEGMKVLHERNIIHRDLKMENILIKDGIVKISDFGFAKIMKQDQLTVHSMKCGSPATMAPEIYLSQKDYLWYSKNNDVFSLGVILHEIFYKVHPYNLEEARLINLNRVRVGNPDPVVEDFLKKALQHSPEKRMSFEQVFKHTLIKKHAHILKQIQQKYHLQQQQQKQNKGNGDGEVMYQENGQKGFINNLIKMGKNVMMLSQRKQNKERKEPQAEGEQLKEEEEEEGSERAKYQKQQQQNDVMNEEVVENFNNNNKIGLLKHNIQEQQQDNSSNINNTILQQMKEQQFQFDKNQGLQIQQLLMKDGETDWSMILGLILAVLLAGYSCMRFIARI